MIMLLWNAPECSSGISHYALITFLMFREAPTKVGS